MLMSLIANRYVDTVSLDSITEKAIPLILDELDPHSVYVPAKDMAAMNESLDGEFDGIGVMFNMATDTVIVLNVINAGPSAKAGVLGGDRIIKITRRRNETAARTSWKPGQTGHSTNWRQRAGANHRNPWCNSDPLHQRSLYDYP